MAYRHGVYIEEQPTSVLPPVRVSASLPVVVGAAPVNQVADPQKMVNKPFLAYTYREAVEALGFCDDTDNKDTPWGGFHLCEFMDAYFRRFAVSPVVFINVLDPDNHTASVSEEEHSFDDGELKIKNPGIMKNSVEVKEDVETDPTIYTEGVDYVLDFDSDGYLVVTRLDDGDISQGATVKISYDYLDPSSITASDIEGGVDQDGNKSGLELVNEVFPRFRLVPGQILAPGWSHDTAVASLMAAKAGNINEHFTAIAVTDLDDSEVKKYQDAPQTKNDNNFTDSLQVVCWPRLKLGNRTYWMSSQLAGLMAQVDGNNEGIPVASPSNQNLQMDTALANGEEVWLGPEQAAYLNGQGIVTALNFIGGWKAWGNRTAAYPGNTDPKEAFVPIRRMFNWIGNTLVQTFWQRVDYPVRKRLVETVVDSANIWLNGLAAREFILGGRVTFPEDLNPVTDLMDGIVRFHVRVTPPSPARDLTFVLEYDSQYFEALFD